MRYIKNSHLLQHKHHFPPGGALLLIRHGVRDRLEAGCTSATFLRAEQFDLVRLHVAVLDELGDDGEEGGDVVVERSVRFVPERRAVFANTTELDLVGGKGVIAGFGGPRSRSSLICQKTVSNPCPSHSSGNKTSKKFVKTLTKHQSWHNIASAWMWRCP